MLSWSYSAGLSGRSAAGSTASVRERAASSAAAAGVATGAPGGGATETSPPRLASSTSTGECASSSCAPEFPVVPYEQLPACKPTSNTMLSTPCRRVCKERLEPLEDGGPLHFFVLDAICIGVFSVEFICRMLASPATIGLRAFITNVPNWIDLIAILPFYIDLIIFLIAGGSSGGKVRQQVRLEPDAASRAWTPYRISGAAAE